VHIFLFNSGNLVGSATFLAADFIFLLMFVLFYRKSFKDKAKRSGSSEVGQISSDKKRATTPKDQ
jgi:hypothetical protein